MSPICKHLNPAYLLIFILLVAIFSLSCSAPAYRVHPDFGLRAQAISQPVLMPPDVKIFESLPGGMVVLRDDWSTIGRENLQDAVVKGFAEKNCSVRLLDADNGMNEELAEIQSLYKVVNKSIRLQAYGPPKKSSGPPKFEYSIGSLERVLPKLDADAVIFVSALEKISNSKSMAVINLAIADSSGTIIWYSIEGSRDRYGLIKFSDAAQMVNNLMLSYPKVGG
ncbi:MAG: hypothetical protein JRF72_18005 [Deltaproteobacteria bacterium]|nr:hypothetical protein [Deltaproteobacteria bacterium]